LSGWGVEKLRLEERVTRPSTCSGGLWPSHNLILLTADCADGLHRVGDVNLSTPQPLNVSTSCSTNHISPIPVHSVFFGKRTILLARTGLISTGAPRSQLSHQWRVSLFSRFLSPHWSQTKTSFNCFLSVGRSTGISPFASSLMWFVE